MRHLRTLTLWYYLKQCLYHRISPLLYFDIHHQHSQLGYVSKYKLNSFVPQQYRLKTILLSSKESTSSLFTAITTKFTFPCIIKPEWGFSSHGVSIVNNKKQLYTAINSIHQSGINFVCQEYCAYANEYDLHYTYDDKNHRILAVTRTDMPTVTGNGIDTLKTLIDKSALHYKPTLLQLNSQHLTTIIPRYKIVQLTSTNSMLSGSQYIHETEFLKHNVKALTYLIKDLQSFKINRISLKANTKNDILKGDFKIIEMNILFPAPVHVLDKKYNSKEKRAIINDTITAIMPLLYNQKSITTVKDKIKVLAKNHQYAKTIKRLRQ